MVRRCVNDTPEYQKLLTCPHVMGVKESVEYLGKPDMTEKDIPEIIRVLTVTCDMTLDPADPKYDRKAMLAVATAINNLFVYAKTDRNFDKVVVQTK